MCFCDAKEGWHRKESVVCGLRISSLRVGVWGGCGGARDGGGERHRAPPDQGRHNTAIKTAVAAGDHPNDLMDKRDQLLDKLSRLGQVSVTDLGNGPIQVAFGDAAKPLVDDGTVTWPQTPKNAGPPPTTAGGKPGPPNDL